jgi:hypothetical protein
MRRIQSPCHRDGIGLIDDFASDIPVHATVIFGAQDLVAALWLIELRDEFQFRVENHAGVTRILGIVEKLLDELRLPDAGIANG